MGFTADEQPVIGEVPSQEGLWICAGFNGHGLWNTLKQKILADR
jgi:glycine/D-amino acid oxidase-like deaminating enzyme